MPKAVTLGDFINLEMIPVNIYCHGKSSPVRGSVTPLPVPIYRGLLPTNLQLTRASKTAIPLRDIYSCRKYSISSNLDGF
jgi:hypothetical protein